MQNLDCRAQKILESTVATILPVVVVHIFGHNLAIFLNFKPDCSQCLEGNKHRCNVHAKTEMRKIDFGNISIKIKLFPVLY